MLVVHVFQKAKIIRNYSATKTQRHKGNKKISIIHSYLKEKNALQEKVEQ